MACLIAAVEETGLPDDVSPSPAPYASSGGTWRSSALATCACTTSASTIPPLVAWSDGPMCSSAQGPPL
jgi:hypothetical protein